MLDRDTQKTKVTETLTPGHLQKHDRECLADIQHLRQFPFVGESRAYKAHHI